ncbi:co-chaperone YbbN [Klebsiella variicola]|uniref:thioredoxin family protein n=2 Tax=Klebsiella variicola TaxID=244366 RepID=UPI000E2C73DE|nr:thioredoxin domain-containing protein [Klebsiella variicola]SXG02831.1 thioredoxin [Klebsiella variicola]HCI5738439.1 thioredoxin [Klebsiella variicola subsp. variicola]HCI6877879.1 thioredoxin [Klebsiella quasipneumoniae subsp. similipneumoniae]HED4010339.1 thioredoxin [Klebsiella variicola subsp. variicola]
MSEVIAVNDESLDALLATGDLVLLDLWAPWCQPCRTLAPLLETLARDGAPTLTVAKINVEKYPAAQQRFAVRGLPTLLLFRAGVEISRQLGVKTLPQLRTWLAAEGAVFSESAIAPPAAQAPWPAFYHDPSLYQFLAQRLREHAEAAEIKVSFQPFWADGQGTTAAALAHHEHPAVFERITGIPAALASMLDVLAFTTPQQVEALLAVLVPGRDLGLVPLSWLHGLLSDASLGWAAALENVTLDDLRRLWLTLAEDELNGQPPQATAWQPLLNACSSLAIALRREQQLESSLLELLGALSPPPAATEVASWVGIGIQLRFVLGQFVQIQAGWSTEERETPARREAWFREWQRQEPDGRFSEARLNALRAEWLRDNSAFSLKEEALYERYGELMDDLTQPLRQALLSLLAAAPEFVAQP